MAGYSIVDHLKIADHITFIRINPNDIELTLREVFTSLADLSWINAFDKDYVRGSFQVRAEATVKYISENIIKSSDDKITSDSGEYVISELARLSIINELKYSDIPLAELIKKQKSGNPGFDFYSKNKSNILLFGEAKYLAAQNAYGSAFKQIVRFISEESDIGDLQDIDKFCCEISLSNVINKKKGYVAAFASKNTDTELLVRNIQENEEYKALMSYNEIICVAVNI
ncbi:hypothetical protein [Algoriphagus sp. A40]|uniref:hypothetical protein n=1 Tax=Algoriphagus sp. A40 TaxID=1945863 RepID=UPI0009856CC2|nr:hypothetical protein [Algoriphagus sp. A40]OOG77486.1 hypothetical protein B0E43_05140 [Algoriphagus sp. A40]